MKSNHKFIDSPEFDEFFRRGDESAHGADSLQPVIDSNHDEVPEVDLLRTPAQRARRAKFIKIVSVTMAILSVGSASAFTYKAIHASNQGLTASLIPSVNARAPVESTLPRPFPQEEAQRILVQPIVDATPPGVTEPVAAHGSQVAPPANSEHGSHESNPHEVDPPELAASQRMLDGSPRAARSSESLPEASASAAVHPSGAPSVAGLTEARQSGGSSATQRVTAKTQALPIAVASKSVARGPAPIAATKGAVGQVKAPLPRLAVSKTVGPKPDGYRPPTASFSD